MFHNTVPENNDAPVPSSYEFQTVPQQKSGSCICRHSQTAIATSALLCNWQPPKPCFSGSNKRCHIVWSLSTIQLHTAYIVALELDGTSTIWWIFGDMSRLKGWVVNRTGSGSCTLVDFCICGAERFGWWHNMRSKTETEQNLGERSACCQWELSKAETKSNKWSSQGGKYHHGNDGGSYRH